MDGRWPDFATPFHVLRSAHDTAWPDLGMCKSRQNGVVSGLQKSEQCKLAVNRLELHDDAREKARC
jgi:hypothetical protein